MYAGSALLLTVLHIIVSYVYEPTIGSDPRLTIFVKSKSVFPLASIVTSLIIITRKHPYYLNGRTLFLVTSQVSLGCLYILRNALMDRSSVRWTSSLSDVRYNSSSIYALLTPVPVTQERIAIIPPRTRYSWCYNSDTVYNTLTITSHRHLWSLKIGGSPNLV